ncbi:MAG: aldo/keto reductase [Bacteroidota bacterium]
MKSITVRGITIPTLGLGTYQLTGPVNVDLMTYALESGYRQLDTAQMYQNEEEVGRAIQQSSINREDIFLTTKVLPANLGKETFLPSVEESLKKLKVDQVDLLLVHWPNSSLPLEEYITELMKAQEKGYANHIGVSNFPIALIEATLNLGANIIANQVEYHLFLDQQKLLSSCRKYDIMLTAYSPIAQGKVIGNEVVESLGKKYGKSATQISLRWLVQQDKVSAIPRSSKKERVDENADIFDFELSPKDMDLLRQLHSPSGRLVVPPDSPAWD